MSTLDKEFTGSIPEFYDSYLVPLIFEFYAADMAERAARLQPSSVLELAAGSGVLTRALAPKLPTNANYVVTDLNLPMLEFAAAKQPQAARDERGAPEDLAGPNMSWQQADAEELPFDNDSFDIVICQFGVMFFENRKQAYAEAIRVLKPGGQFLFSVWDAIEHNELAQTVTEAAAEIFPDDPPQFLPRTPHGYHDQTLINLDLVSAGFSSITFETIAATSTAPTPRHPALAYCQGTPLRNEIEARDPELLAAATGRASIAIATKWGTGEVSAKMQAHIISAHK